MVACVRARWEVVHLNLLGLGRGAALISAFLPLLGLAPLDAVHRQCDAGGGVLGCRVRHGGG